MSLFTNLSVELGTKMGVSSSNLISKRIGIKNQEAEEQTVHVMPLAAGASGTAISLGSISSAQLALIYSDLPIGLAINGAATPVTGTLLVLNGAAITSLAVSNPNPTDASLTIVLIGE